MLLEELLQYCFLKGIPFVSFQQPGEQVQTIFASIDQIRSLHEKEIIPANKAFIFAPFEERKEKIFFPAQFTLKGSKVPDEILKQSIFESNGFSLQPSPYFHTSREDYEKQFRKFYSAIEKGEVEKIVASRRIVIPPLGIEQYANLYKQLLIEYLNAFVYWFYVPGLTCYMGASPEVLLQTLHDDAQTMSLAGTMPVDSPKLWGRKEIEEQALVSRYITKVLEDMGLTAKISPTEDKMAGRIKHLCTQFKFKLAPDVFLELASRLHPTPAVAGIPIEASLELIKEVESQSRRFYSGYAGLLNLPERAFLFVNLRSMEIFADGICLFTGGGLTIDSELEKEWVETERKAQTLLTVIEKIRKFAPKQSHDQR